MTHDEFKKVVDDQLNYCSKLLTSKGEEYVGDKADRLEAFKLPAALRKTTPKEILFGYMLKHLTSLSDMCREDSKDRDKWVEKITDSINYLLLLRGLVEEDAANEKN